MENRKIGLDYVRAIAILSVLISHSFSFFGNPDSQLAVPFGTAGVEIFFVLSGLLIGGIFFSAIQKASGKITGKVLGEFWVRRWLRTIPNYLLFVVVYALLHHLAMLRLLPFYLTFTQNFAWSIRGDFFDVSWSLAVEEWFYLLMPLMAFAVFLLTRRHRTAMFVTMGILFVVPIVLRLTLGQGKNWDDEVRKVVIYRIDAIMWGVLLAALQRYRPRVFSALQRPLVFLCGIALLLATCLWVYAENARNGDFTCTYLTAFIFTGFNIGCALALPLCAAIAWAPTVINRAAYFVSVWSYSMYLCHVVVFKAVDRAYHVVHVFPPAAFRAVTAWPLVFALSAAVYYFFELPTLRFRDRWTHHPSPASQSSLQHSKAT